MNLLHSDRSNMSVVTGALGSLAPKLLQLLHDEYKLQKGVRKRVQWLHSELESIHALLRKVSDVPWDRLDEQVKVWAREVREASYDMEDVLDTFLVRVDGGAGEPADPSRLKRAMNKMGKVFGKAKARRSISGAIQDIKKHLEEVAERRQRYKLDDIIMTKPVAATSSIDPRLTAMYKQVTQLIGVDKSRDELISMLMNPSQLGVGDDAADKVMKKVSIVGVGGLGKTTLAKAVYDKLKPQYDCGAFVSIGRDYDPVKVFKDILYHLDPLKFQEIHNKAKGVHILIDDLRRFLEDKRYFVVIDDVWDLRTWKTIEVALVDTNCGSKIITTTRKFDVAEEAGEVYKLKPLSYDDSMKLFHTRTFGADKYLDNKPDDISNKITRKCGGIPLAIITMASLLAGKHKFEWSEVLNSIGFGPKDNREVEDTMTILSFSYYDLPPHLRTCLLYLSTYPEDYLIEKDSLISKWIAEGFIDRKQGTRLFELGESYFNDLINRSLVQVVENKWDGTVFGCRVHDMVLDLIRKLSFEENFVALLGDNNVEETPAPSSGRRLAHQNRIAEHIVSEANVTGMSKVRSYTAFMCPRINNLDHLSGFQLLRVLDIVECTFWADFHLEHLGDLLHLRYLGIRKCRGINDLPELPKRIGNLKLLQTLDLDGHRRLPVGFVQLTKLVRLCAKKMDAPEGIGNLTSLEELRIGGIPNRLLKELGSLRELRVLEFSTTGLDESMQMDFLESIRNLKRIQRIDVGSSSFSKADTTMWEAASFVLPQPLGYLEWCFYFSKLPSCINPSCLPNLSHLKLWVATMDEQDLKLLAMLPALCYVQLYTESTVTASSNINSGDSFFFQKLRYFGTDQMVQFERLNHNDSYISLHLWNREGAIPFVASRKTNDSSIVVPYSVMPNLESLNFFVPLRALKDNNGNFVNIGLEYLPSLREVIVWVNCGGLSAAERDDALAALRNTCKLHPNNPTIYMRPFGQTG